MQTANMIKHEDQYIMIVEAKCSQQELIAARFCQFGELLIEKCDKTEPPDATLAHVRTLSLTCRPVGMKHQELLWIFSGSFAL